MFNLSKFSKKKYHRFEYHARYYDLDKSDRAKRRDTIKNELADGHFDVIERYKRHKQKKAFRLDLLLIGSACLLSLIFSLPIISFFKALMVESKYKEFLAFLEWFLIITFLGALFIKRSKKRNA